MWTVFAFCAVAIATTSAYDNNNLFESFRVQFKKDYHPKEVAYRKAVFLDNVDYINKHNALAANGTYTYTLGINDYADMTNLEFVKFMNGYRPDPNMTLTTKRDEYFTPTGKATPAHVDWREEGWVSPVKNQRQCGSCWAFSTTGAIEAQHFNRTRKMVLLSEQNLMDCSTIYGNAGCQGGWPYNAMKYVIYNNGVDTEASYPYTARNGKCHFMSNHVGSTCETYRFVRPGDEVGLQEAVAGIGPVSVAIDASHRGFHLYRSGVYNEPLCSPRKLDHAVLVVGYGTWEGQRYWLVKNSWGSYWGIEGYIRMSRFRANQCGIATVAVYPLLR